MPHVGTEIIERALDLPHRGGRLGRLLFDSRYSVLVIVDLPKGDFGSRQSLVEAVDGLSLRNLVGVHPSPKSRPTRPPAKPNRITNVLRLNSNLHFAHAVIAKVSDERAIPPEYFRTDASVCSPMWPSSRTPATFCSDFTRTRRTGVTAKSKTA